MRPLPHLRRALLALLLAPALAHASPPAPPTTDEPDEQQEVVAAEAPVTVRSAPSDGSIAERLVQVLEATDRFTQPSVSVRNGVVSLHGEANSEAMRDLAESLAQRTEGVVAVVNNMTVKTEPVFTLAPARRELDILIRDVIRATPLFVVALLIFTLALLFAGVIARLATRVLGRATDSELLRNVLHKAVFLLVLVLGAYLALRVTGLTRVAIAVISGTGLLGLALGFAFRDIAENFLASLLLSIQRPFRLGDVIEVDGHLGVVRKVTARGTLLIDFDGNHIQIANATVYKNTIKNFTANPRVRINFAVGIGYDDEIARAQDVIHAVLENHPAVLDDPEPLVLVESLGASSVTLRTYFWIDGAKHSMLKMKSSAIRMTLRALTDAGVSMPDEAREVIFPQGVPVAMGATSDAPAPPSAPDAPKLAEEVVVEAEGDLSSETDDLNRQAESSRDPDEGDNVLADQPGAAPA
ncbi:MAG: mechanosensitive ion channel domain-containing protein [Phycisphaerales bacterium JB059]